MSLKLKLQKYQITLLELHALNNDWDATYAPAEIKMRLGKLVPLTHVKGKLKQGPRARVALWRRIDYLKKQHYLEQVRENEQRLYKLTAKAKFAILRLQFALHMQEQRTKSGDGNFYLIVFDIPEQMKKYRDLFRSLLKANGFRFLQLSVWLSRYNPHPAIDELLKYLGLERHFEIMKISCKECSPRLQRITGRR